MATYLNTSFNYSNIVIKQEVVDIPENNCDESSVYNAEEISDIYFNESTDDDSDEIPMVYFNESTDEGSDENVDVVGLGEIPDVFDRNDTVDLSRIKMEYVETEQQTFPVLKNYFSDNQRKEQQLLTKMCFVNLHQGVNQKEISSCRFCRHILNPKEPKTTEKPIESLNKQEKSPCRTGSKKSDLKQILAESKRTEYNSKPLHSDLSRNCCESSMPASRRKQNLKHLLNQPEQIRYECTVCFKTFSSKTILKRHSFLHLEEKQFYCNVCHETFIDRRSFQVHSATHSDERFQCLECNEEFSRKSEAMKHALSHSGKKLFTCNICQKQFSEKYTLTRHAKIHKKEKKYFCYICCITFSSKSQMDKHMSFHTEEKPFKCTEEHCHRSYVHKKSLDNHVLTSHSFDEVPPILCKGCYVTFLTTESWKEHLLECVVDCIQRKDRTNVVSILKGLKGIKTI